MRASTRGPRRVHHERAVSLRGDGGLRVVVVADTHGAPHPESARVIAARKPDLIAHAGDIGDLSVLDRLAEIAPVIAVRGNIDERASDLPDVVTIDLRAGAVSAIKLLLLHIAVRGPKIRADAAELARRAGASLILCGHSHVPFLGKDRGLVVFNAGSIGPRRFQLPIVFGVLEIADGQLSMEHVSCETGLRWEP